MKKNLFDKIFTWYILLTKRLFKKKSFVLVLLLLPCLSAGLLLVSTQESGVLTVALVAEKKEAADKVGFHLLSFGKNSNIIFLALSSFISLFASNT